MPTYSPKVYRQQGATEMVVSSGGLISVEDGGLLNIEAGGGLQIGGSAFVTTGGYVSLPSQVFLPILTASSGTVVLPTYGVSVIYSSGTGTGPAGYTMAAAAAGQFKACLLYTSPSPRD